MEAASAVVAHVIGIVQLGGIEDGEGNAMLFGKGERVALLRSRQAGRVGQHRQHCIAQFLVCHPCQQTGVNSARISNQYGAERAQMTAQRGEFLVAAVAGIASLMQGFILRQQGGRCGLR